MGQGCYHKGHYSEYVLYSTLSLYSTLISIVLMDYNTLSYAIDDFYLFYDGAVDIQKWALLTRSEWKGL